MEEKENFKKIEKLEEEGVHPMFLQRLKNEKLLKNHLRWFETFVAIEVADCLLKNYENKSSLEKFYTYSKGKTPREIEDNDKDENNEFYLIYSKIKEFLSTNMNNDNYTERESLNILRGVDLLVRGIINDDAKYLLEV